MKENVKSKPRIKSSERTKIKQELRTELAFFQNIFVRPSKRL